MNIVNIAQSIVLPLFFKFALAAIIAIVVKDLPKWSEELIAWVKAHSKAKVVQNLVAWLVHNAENVVLKLEADTRPYMKELEDDGSLTKEGRAKLRQQALTDLKAQLGPSVISLVHEVLGINSAALDGFLTGIIEGAVGKLNAAQSQNDANAAQAAQASASHQAMAFLQKAGVEMGMLPAEKTELAVVKPLPTAAPEPEPKVDLPTDKQLAEVKDPVQPSPK